LEQDFFFEAKNALITYFCNMRKSIIVFFLAVMGVAGNTGCNSSTSKSETTAMENPHKIIVYQVFTRLYGNSNTNNKPWGTKEENGVGKFNDFTDRALDQIKDLGVTHIWYTGVPHHALIGDYTDYGISLDDPDVVKGRAGSPYAVKDYYDVNPDLAVDPERRLEEFEELIARTHNHGLKVVIDIVPNHVARKYEGTRNPAGVRDFGADDDTSVAYHRNNNFYYITGISFSVPEPLEGYLPLGGESHPLADGKYEETPAKWTGNGSRAAQPHFYDWYETVKINYGITPNGEKEFPLLPEDYAEKDAQAHFDFWLDKDVPDSWKKFKDIALYWIDKGVDGFRYDMAEMVPVEFWSYMNSAIKTRNPDAFLLAEIYNPAEYRNYLHLGKMDYLYDKVELYDTLKNIMQGRGSTDNLVGIRAGLADIEQHMLHFLENHDEQRIASPEFLGNPEKAKPGMVVSAMIGSAPVMIYFGQEVGEPGAEDAGFGSPSRTSIFDYIGVPHHQRWMNKGKFDGGPSTGAERALRDFYKRLLNLTRSSPALAGAYQEIHSYNRQNTTWYNDRVFSFVRWNQGQYFIIVSNFSHEESYGFDLTLPEELTQLWGLGPGEHQLEDRLYGKKKHTLLVHDGTARARVDLAPLESLVLEVRGQ
jgi:glycosidase